MVAVVEVGSENDLVLRIGRVIEISGAHVWLTTVLGLHMSISFSLVQVLRSAEDA